MRRAMLAAAALVLVGAAPASAVTGGYGVSAALRLGPAPLAIQLQPANSRSKHQVCEATEVVSKKAEKAYPTLKKMPRLFAPVACEEPPRSWVNMPNAFRHSTAAAFGAVG